MKPAYAPLVLLLLCACSGENPTEAGKDRNSAVDERAAAAVSPVWSAVPTKGADAAIVRQDAVLEFRYEFPGEAAAIAPLDTWLRAHADGQYRQAHKDAAAFKETADKEGFPFHKYSYDQKWEVVANLPAALVMESNGYSYTGGAHGMPFTTSLIWDRAAGQRLGTAAILDKGVLAKAAYDAFCNELDRQREEKRGEPVNPKADGGISDFNTCPMMGSQEIIPLSRKGRALDTIRVVIGPYVAGPYVEGSYEIELPVTTAMLAAVKPAYRGWFSTGTP